VTRSLPLTFAGTGAVVTGAASGIGAAITALLTTAGVRTLALDRADAPARDGELLVSHRIDVRDREALDAVLAQTFPDGLHYLVNCAGIPPHGGFRGVDPVDWRTVLEVNLVGAYHLIDACADLLGTGAAIVNITSMEASRVIALSNPDPHPHYAASKAALAMLTRTAARALGPKVRVNSVAPGFVATPMAAEHGDTSRLPPQLAARTVLGRWAQPADIAAAATFLLSDQAGYITGTELTVDGGFATT